MIIKINIKNNDLLYLYLRFLIIIFISAWTGALIGVVQDSYSFVFCIIYSLIISLLLFIATSCCYIYDLKKKGILGEHTVEITPDYFREATAYNDDKYDWHKIKIKKSKQYILVSLSWRKGFFIPIRELTPEELNKFYDLAVSYQNQTKKAAN